MTATTPFIITPSDQDAQRRPEGPAAFPTPGATSESEQSLQNTPPAPKRPRWFDLNLEATEEDSDTTPPASPQPRLALEREANGPVGPLEPQGDDLSSVGASSGLAAPGTSPQGDQARAASEWEKTPSAANPPGLAPEEEDDPIAAGSSSTAHGRSLLPSERSLRPDDRAAAPATASGGGDPESSTMRLGEPRLSASPDSTAPLEVPAGLVGDPTPAPPTVLPADDLTRSLLLPPSGDWPEAQWSAEAAGWGIFDPAGLWEAAAWLRVAGTLALALLLWLRGELRLRPSPFVRPSRSHGVRRRLPKVILRLPRRLVVSLRSAVKRGAQREQ